MAGGGLPLDMLDDIGKNDRVNNAVVNIEAVPEHMRDRGAQTASGRLRAAA